MENTTVLKICSTLLISNFIIANRPWIRVGMLLLREVRMIRKSSFAASLSGSVFIIPTIAKP